MELDNTSKMHYNYQLIREVTLPAIFPSVLGGVISVKERRWNRQMISWRPALFCWPAGVANILA